jgi:hypothetical protein
VAAGAGCVEALSSGVYVVRVVPAEGYGLTAPDGWRVEALPGGDLRLAAGAAQGVVLPDLPAVDIEAVVEDVPVAAPPRPTVSVNPIRDNLGWIAFGLAGVVLLGGLSMALWLRRR